MTESKMSIVIKQHYVWRHYLRPWANRDIIWCYLKDTDKLLKSNLMNVAQERYFYKLVDFTKDEEIFLRKYIEKNSSKFVKNLNLNFLQLFTSVSKLKKKLEATTNSTINGEGYAEKIRRLEVNLMEIVHGKIEILGEKLLLCQNIDDLKALENDEYLFDAIMFLCFQYYRTKSMRKSVLQDFIGDPYERLMNKSWNILSYVHATTLSEKISCDPDLKFIFIENYTSNHFITSDQPVFNILSDQVDESGDVTHLEFYYPISPYYALTIHFRDDQADKYVSNVADEIMVDWFNKKVFDNADFFVFASSQEQLERMK